MHESSFLGLPPCFEAAVLARYRHTIVKISFSACRFRSWRELSTVFVFTGTRRTRGPPVTIASAPVIFCCRAYLKPEVGRGSQSPVWYYSMVFAPHGITASVIRFARYTAKSGQQRAISPRSIEGYIDTFQWTFWNLADVDYMPFSATELGVVSRSHRVLCLISWFSTSMLQTRATFRSFLIHVVSF
jgi:hypothetical protein